MTNLHSLCHENLVLNVNKLLWFNKLSVRNTCTNNWISYWNLIDLLRSGNRLLNIGVSVLGHVSLKIQCWFLSQLILFCTGQLLSGGSVRGHRKWMRAPAWCPSANTKNPTLSICLIGLPIWQYVSYILYYCSNLTKSMNKFKMLKTHLHAASL